MKFYLAFLLLLPNCALALERVVSVGGALTETIYALGAQAVLVGADTTSYYPPAAEKLPKVGYQRALSSEGILSLRPDSVFLTDAAGPDAVIEQIRTAGVAIYRFQTPHDIRGVQSNIGEIAQLLRRQAHGQSLIEAMDAKHAQLQRAVAARAGARRVLFILRHGAGPALVAGTDTAAHAIMTLAGVDNAVTTFAGYKPLTPEAATVLAPDWILVTRQGLEQSGGAQSLLAAPGIALTAAARHQRLVVMDALLLLGFGPRTVDAALELHSKVYAD